MFTSIEDTRIRLRDAEYVADESLSTSLFLALKMERPLFLEGAPGVGKTEVARVLSQLFDTELIRLQCYEGLDVNQALYEWNYTRQLLSLQSSTGASVADVYDRSYLLERPLLRAINPDLGERPVLLIDEVDRADEEFESFLLELLGDFQVTIPELGTIRATQRPYVILTSNRTREVHDALKRRCLYAWVDYPDAAKESEIVRRKVPDLPNTLVSSVVKFVAGLRAQDLQKPPGVAETLDWARALVHLGVSELEVPNVKSTLGVLLKHRDDIEAVSSTLTEEMLEAS